MRKVLMLVLLLLGAGPAFADGALVGVARIPSDARDSLGETLGGFGSGMALVPGSLHRSGGGFTAQLAMLPDRGWNTEGTTDYKARLQIFDAAFTPQKGLTLTYRHSLLLTDARGAPTTGLDPDSVRPAAGALPDLPQAPNGRISLDDESLAFARDGSFWVGDEYGPYIYHYNAHGRMIGAIRPPAAIVPMRGGKENFSAGETAKGEPQSGRQNNQGIEGMSLTPDHHYLFAALQSALVQDLDPADAKETRRHVRLLQYDLSGARPKLAHEYVIALPNWSDGKTADLVAAQSEMLALDDHRLLLLCRDSGGGFTGKRDASAFRQVMLVDLAGASDIAGRYDGVGESVAPLGVLRPAITPTRLTSLLDINDNAQLAKFGLHNGAPNDTNDLYEKWESLALIPASGGDDYLLVGSDNDFITQHGMMAGKPYADASGANVDSLVLLYRLHRP